MFYYVVYLMRKDNGDVIMSQEFEDHEKAVEVAEIFSNSEISYTIVEDVRADN